MPPNNHLQVHLRSRIIMASKCISNLALLWPPTAFPTLLNHSISNFTQLQPPIVSLNSPNYGLQVHMIVASKCISNLAHSDPPSLHDYCLQVHLQTRSITASKVHLCIHSIFIFRSTLNCCQVLLTASPDIPCTDR